MSSQGSGRKALLRLLSEGASTLSVLYTELIRKFKAFTSAVETRVIHAEQGSPQPTTDITDALAKLARRGRILHVGGKCPCDRECSTFTLRRQNQCGLEDSPQSGLDVLDCIFRKVNAAKSISERLGFKLDTLSSQKQEVAEFVKELSASISAINRVNKTAQKLEAAKKRKRVQQAACVHRCTLEAMALMDGDVATSSLTAQGGAASTHTPSSFAGKEGDEDDEEDDEEWQQPRKGRKSNKRVIADSSDDDDA